jgi:hypothetical protein
MKKLENFVKNTFKNYQDDDRDQLIKSITEMLTEKVEDLVEHGYTKQDAIDKAVMEFGTLEDYEVNPKKMVRRFKRRRTIRQYKYDIFFAFGGSLIIIGMLIFVDLQYTTTDVIWFVVPALAVLWWPLATIYRYLLKKETIKEEDDDE